MVVEFALENSVNAWGFSSSIFCWRLCVCDVCEMTLVLRDKGIGLGDLNVPN